MADIEELEPFLQHLVTQLKPAQKKQLLNKIGRQLRKSTKQRHSKQQNPDGSAWEPRKNAKTKRPKKLFRSLAKTKHLRLKATANNLRLGWAGRTGRIANEHHHGLRARVAKDVFADYPERKLIGLSDADINDINQALIDHFSQ